MVLMCIVQLATCKMPWCPRDMQAFSDTIDEAACATGWLYELVMAQWKTACLPNRMSRVQIPTEMIKGLLMRPNKPGFVVISAQNRQLKCSRRAPGYFTLIGDKAAPPTRHRTEVARALRQRCYPHTGNGGNSWCLGSSLSL